MQTSAVSHQRSAGDVRSINNPIAWVGADRLLLNDTTSLGLRRKVIAHKGDVPNTVAWLQAAFEEARDAKVHWWLVTKGDDGYLWIVWKAI